MRVRVLTDRADHPTLAAAAGLLQARHRVEFVDPDRHPPAARLGPGDWSALYLLKSRRPGARSTPSSA